MFWRTQGFALVHHNFKRKEDNMNRTEFEFFVKLITAIAIVGALFIAIAMQKNVIEMNPLMPEEKEIQYQESFMPDEQEQVQYVELYVDDMKFGEVFWVMRNWNRDYFYWRGKKYHTLTLEELDVME